MKASRYLSTKLPAAAHACLTGVSLFASLPFAAVWETLGGRPVVWVVEDGGEIAAVLPGVEFGRGPLRRFAAMPDGLYARLLIPPRFYDRLPEVSAVLWEAMIKERYTKLFVYDFHHRLEPDARLKEITLTTSLVDIDREDWEPPDRKLRTEIRKAEREGIVLQSMDWERHGESFLALMRATEAMHDREAKYSPEFFARLAELSLTDARVQWLWCEHEGRAAASQIYFVEDDMLLGWQMYYDRQFSHLKANQFLIQRMCREAYRHGVRRLNLGGTPEAATGTDFFKQRWGGYTYEYTGYELKQGIGRLV